MGKYSWAHPDREDILLFGASVLFAFFILNIQMPLELELYTFIHNYIHFFHFNPVFCSDVNFSNVKNTRT